MQLIISSKKDGPLDIHEIPPTMYNDRLRVYCLNFGSFLHLCYILRIWAENELFKIKVKCLPNDRLTFDTEKVIPKVEWKIMSTKIAAEMNDSKMKESLLEWDVLEKHGRKLIRPNEKFECSDEDVMYRASYLCYCPIMLGLECLLKEEWTYFDSIYFSRTYTINDPLLRPMKYNLIMDLKKGQCWCKITNGQRLMLGPRILLHMFRCGKKAKEPLSLFESCKNKVLKIYGKFHGKLELPAEILQDLIALWTNFKEYKASTDIGRKN